MQAPRHIGIDLHRNQFTCCVRLENGRNYLTEWKLEDLPRFVKKLRPADEIAVEVTGNTRLFYEAVAPSVARVVAVDPKVQRQVARVVRVRLLHRVADHSAVRSLTRMRSYVAGVRRASCSG